MNPQISCRTITILASAIFVACLNQNESKMIVESDNIVSEVKVVFSKLTECSERAQLDSFLSGYDHSPTFCHFCSDGKMRNYEELKKNFTEYYNTLKEQKIKTIQEKFNVIDTNLVVLGWTGNIIAQFKNGDTMKMGN